MSSGVPLNWYAVLLVVAAVATWVLTFPARRIAVQIGYVAQPDITFEATARRYEPGALNMLALHGMKASLELILGLGVKQIEARLLDLRSFSEDRLMSAGFRVMGFANRRSQKSGITTIAIENPENAVIQAKKLRDNRIDVSMRQTRSGLSCLRLSPHFYNTEDEIEEVIKILLS